MEIAWVEYQKCWGWVIKRAPSYVIVKYELNGIQYEEIADPDEIIDPKEMGVDYESDS